MPGTTASSRPSSLRRLCAVSLTLAAALLVAPAAPNAGLAPASAVEPAATPVAARTLEVPQTTPATGFRVGNFNVLGADHTAPGGNRKGWESGTVRMDRVVSLLGQNTLDVVGFQEFQPPQAARFTELMGTSWQTYPGLNNPAGPSVNSIGWRTDVWTAPRGAHPPDPLLRRRAEPDAGRAPAERRHRPPRVVLQHPQPVPTSAVRRRLYRDAGFAMEVALANELRAAYPDAPFISLGDKNERAQRSPQGRPRHQHVVGEWRLRRRQHVLAARRVARSTGSWAPRTCSSTATPASWNDFVSKTSDHPSTTANVVVPASAPVGVDHVVVVAVPGLTSAIAGGFERRRGEATRMANQRHVDHERADRHREHPGRTPT